ncbi:Asp-tRNA(Asn)/Glu-tRNA(Gln) amidotransferase subunit GatC [Pseudopedobacter beijingensis]|uniref:Aspartyl/glutamyl-tRNA(Asn/Gln) amidotransferase subunit C n=1 Tax=Pseudopedobacter beijingensis TaxID=1207056 RepID=A0ABW4I701_9SPHI
MEIDKQTVEKIAHLSRLELSEEEKERSIIELNKILSFMDKLNEVDVTGVEPLIHLNEEINVLRPDKVVQEISKEDALSNAPKKNDDYFIVPKVIK